MPDRRSGLRPPIATAYRYIQEAITLLAALAPSLTAALWRLAWSGHEYAILEGTCFPIDRLGGRLNRLYYCAANTTATPSTCKHSSTWAATCAGSRPGSPDRPTTSPPPAPTA
jgi:hypothetical protein